MRISGYGGGSGGAGAGNRGRDQRRESFRRIFRVGDRVRGVFTRREAPGLGWVRIEGHELLAEIEDTVDPGQPLFFLIRELSPEIVLQALATAGAAGLGLSDLVHGYLLARATFENRMLAHGPQLQAMSRDQRKAAYLACLAAGPELLASWLRLSGLVYAANIELDRRKVGRFSYLPWLLAAGTGVELLWTQGPALFDATLGFAYSGMGRCECRFLCRGERTSFRLALEFPEAKPDLLPKLEGLLPAGTVCLGLGRLTPAPATLLAPFLAQAVEGLAPILSTRA